MVKQSFRGGSIRLLDLTAHTSLSPIQHGFAPSFVNYKKCALDSQPQVIKFTSCLPRVSGSLWVLWLESSTNKTGHHDIAEIGIKTPKNQSNQAVITNNSLFSTQGFEP